MKINLVTGGRLYISNHENNDDKKVEVISKMVSMLGFEKLGKIRFY